MKPFILEQTNWKQVKNQKYEVAVLPWGATEPHNFHLPYGTDSLETAKIAEEAAGKAWEKGAKIMVLPTIPLGIQNPGQIGLPFCLHTKPSTQIIIFKDIVEALYCQGIRKLVLMNGHGGNDFKPMIREVQPQFPGMLISLVEWFKILDLSDYFEEDGDHANEMETSVIMHYFPNLVLPLDEAGDGMAKSSKLKGVLNKTAWIPRQWDKVSEDTGIGDFFMELAECDLEDLYE
jgi:creatinine amidohydrolase